MTSAGPAVLYEDNHLLAVEKPAGVLTMGDDTGDETMVDAAADYLRVKYSKPGNVFVGVVHRLDRPVSGVLLFARTSKAASRLSDQFRRGTVKKVYHAVMSGLIDDQEGTLTDWLLKDRQRNFVDTVPPGTRGAQESTLHYRVLDPRPGQMIVRVEPVTGRSHQIRVQFASRGLPIHGDGKYGSAVRRGGRIDLHASSLTIEHPTTREQITICSPWPNDFPACTAVETPKPA